ncbi:MAG TPA: VWA domain-containing protein [Pyrinomonadaceae bacterium]|nr:VWA domain-containing protein [Pyrinomonadaceae bacterium]
MPAHTPQRAAFPSRAARAARRLLLVAFFSFAFNCQILAQQEVTDEEVVRVETNLVAVPVYVTDSDGRRVYDLTREEFGLTDEGRPVAVSYFAAGAERVALVFLLDASGSVRETTARQREAAVALLSRFGERSRVAVMRFWERPELRVAFTRESEPVRQAFQLPALADRRTAIFDAALAAARAFRAHASDPTERRIVILISDGLDTASTTRPAEVVREARDAGVSFYVIHLPLYAPRDGRLAPRTPSKGFRDLAQQTGGQFFTVGDASASLDPRAPLDLAPVFQSIAEDLRGQYVLGFHAPPATPGEPMRPRRLAVNLTPNRPRKLRLRALRDSYQLR